MGSISACFLEEKSRIETRQKILSEKWAALPLVFSRKWPEESLATEKWTAFPHSVTRKSRSQRLAKNSRRTTGSISSCFYTRNSKIETLQKILVEKWAAFPPVFTRNCKIEDLPKILAQKWAAFRPDFTRKIVKSKTCKKFSQKMDSISVCSGQNFWKKKIWVRCLSW